MNWEEINAFHSGQATLSYKILGAHPEEKGFRFSVWAPNAGDVYLIGDFNNWEVGVHTLSSQSERGFYSIIVPEAHEGQRYKFAIRNRNGMEIITKSDPFAQRMECPPDTASVLFRSRYTWNDEEWLTQRITRQSPQAPISIYEVHLGSWKRKDGTYPSYKAIAHELAQYVHETGFTHIEFLPLTHHPFYGSWGYQCLGYFAPSELFGSPDELKLLIDILHQHNIGVILDWVPAHFPTDNQGLSTFDGSHTFEHADPRKGFHPDWNTAIFNYGRHEVCSFLLSSARFWIEEYHIDGIRVDAVASMLYLDYSRKDGEWIPNEDGGNQNWDAVHLLKELNKSLYGAFPGIITIAEESTAWPGVSRPTYDNGLGFGAKWDMGWMHDTLRYLSRDPIHRRHHHNELTFRGVYAFSENYVLALSHDEVVHGKGSLLNKMPGDEWQKRANLRALFGMMFAQPGKKMLFMGMEFGQWKEWNHEEELDWHLLEHPNHIGLRRCVQELNILYKSKRALHSKDFDATGVEWSGMDDHENSILSFIRFGDDGTEIVITCNLTPNVHHHYGIGVPSTGIWKEIFNSDARIYGGSDVSSGSAQKAVSRPIHQQDQSINLTLPPLSVIYWSKE
jgi:1,4-alpha-glucan branching enzyme